MKELKWQTEDSKKKGYISEKHIQLNVWLHQVHESGLLGDPGKNFKLYGTNIRDSTTWSHWKPAKFLPPLLEQANTSTASMCWISKCAEGHWGDFSLVTPQTAQQRRSVWNLSVFGWLIVWIRWSDSSLYVGWIIRFSSCLIWNSSRFQSTNEKQTELLWTFYRWRSLMDSTRDARLWKLPWLRFAALCRQTSSAAHDASPEKKHCFKRKNHHGWGVYETEVR